MEKSAKPAQKTPHMQVPNSVVLVQPLLLEDTSLGTLWCLTTFLVLAYAYFEIGGHRVPSKKNIYNLFILVMAVHL